VSVRRFTDLVKLCYQHLSEGGWLTVHVVLQEELN